jgi:transcriptional regulator with XRE-family HTH domain
MIKNTSAGEMIKQPFFNWITQERDKRQWNDSELAARAEISQSNLSLIMSGQRNITYDFCLGIAKAFRVRPERVLSLAGLLPPDVGTVDQLTEDEAEIIKLYRKIESELGRELVLKTLRGLASD